MAVNSNNAWELNGFAGSHRQFGRYLLPYLQIIAANLSVMAVGLPHRARHQ